MTARCPCCHQPQPSTRDVLAGMLLRVMPRRIPTRWDAQDLASEAIAVLRELGWQPPDSKDTRARRAIVDAHQMLSRPS